MPHHKTQQNREQLIWGSLGEPREIHLSTNIEIQGISPLLDRQRQTYPPHDVLGQAISWRHAMLSPSIHQKFHIDGIHSDNANSSPRKRKRDADVGKSIHRAAEASQPSPLTGFSQLLDERHSIQLVKRMVPFPRGGEYTRKKRKYLAEDAEDRYAATDGRSHDASGRRLRNTLEYSPDRIPSSDGVISANVRQRATRAQLPTESPKIYRVQSARKTASRKPIPAKSKSPSPKVTILSQRAARKTSARSENSYPRESVSDEDGSESDEEVNFASSHSIVYSSKQLGEEVETRNEDPNPEKNSRTQADNREIVGHSHSAHQKFLNVPSSVVDDSRFTRRRINKSIIPYPDPLHLRDNDLPPPSHSEAVDAPKSSPSAGKMKPPDDLISAFEKISGFTVQMQKMKRLPFLLRNVRRGFRSWCHCLNVNPNDGDHSQTREVSLTFKYTDVLGKPFAYKTKIQEWECPLCSIFGILPTLRSLQKHVQWDHPEVVLDIRDPTESPDENASLFVTLNSQSTTGSTTENLGAEAPRKEKSLSTSSSPRWNVLPGIPRESADDNGLVTFYTHTIPAETSSSMSAKNLSRTHLRPESGVMEIMTHTVDSTLADVSWNQRPARFDIHGPSQPVKATSDYPLNNSMQLITYRPAGPHLYDHLASLPLDIFGPRAWFVLDKEEEIFELTDVLDEDKVICALWGRWILLNRPLFISNYLLGVEAFINEYWRMIDRAAGWGALRAWLLMLVSRRFLKNIEIVSLLKKYNELVGRRR